MYRVDGEFINDTRRGEGFIEDAVRDQLNIINAEALSALEARKNYVIVPLSQFFDIPYMDPNVARNRVYYNICRDLEKRQLAFRLVSPRRYCKICKKIVLRKDLNGKVCKNCNRNTTIPPESRHSVIIWFKTKEEEEENSNIEKWLNEHSI